VVGADHAAHVFLAHALQHRRLPSHPAMEEAALPGARQDAPPSAPCAARTGSPCRRPATASSCTTSIARTIGSPSKCLPIAAPAMGRSRGHTATEGSCFMRA
jgi:hypothetical protein